MRGGSFFHVNAGKDGKEHKDHSDDQREPFEPEDLDLPGVAAPEGGAQELHRHDGCNGDDGASHASAGSGQGSQPLPFATSFGKSGDHGPVRDIHHGIGDSPEDIGNCGIGRKPSGVQSGRAGKHKKQDHRIGQRTDQEPRAKFAPSGLGTGYDNAHNRIIEGIKNPRGKQDDPHSHRADAQNILIVIEHVAGGEHIDHVLSDCAQAVGNLALHRQFCFFHNVTSFPSLYSSAPSRFAPSDRLRHRRPAICSVRSQCTSLSEGGPQP